MNLSKRLKLHAQNIKDIPSNEQNIRIIQAVLVVALNDIAKWIETEEYKNKS